MPRGDGNLSHELLPGEKGPQDACGVFGVYATGPFHFLPVNLDLYWLGVNNATAAFTGVSCVRLGPQGIIFSILILRGGERCASLWA